MRYSSGKSSNESSHVFVLMTHRLQEETAKVEEHLLSNANFSTAIVDCFINSKADSFESLLEPLQKLLRLSPPVASSLAHPDLFSRTAHKLQSKKALVRLNLLRIIRSICDASDEDGALIRTYGLYPAIADLAKHDNAILVREMAGDLIKSSELNARRSMDGARRVLRRSSSSTMTPTLGSNGSLPPTPSSASRAGSYFDVSDVSRPSLRPITTSSPFRPVSRDGESMSPGGFNLPTPTPSSAYGNGAFHSAGLSGHTKSRLPRTRASVTANSGAKSDRDRLSLAPTKSGENVPSSSSRGNGAKSPGLSSRSGERSNAPAGQSTLVANARRRRMTSQG